MSVITLLRHGAVAKKYQQKYIGHSDIDIDTSLFEINKIKQLKKQNFDLIYTSDLKRCVNTIEYISNKYICDKRLREMKFKTNIEGTSFEQIEQRIDYKNEYLESINSWYSYICEESIEELRHRLEEFILALPKNKNILICTHGGTIRMLHSILMKKDFNDFFFKIDYLDAFKYNINL